VKENAILTNEWKVKYESLVEENKKQNDKMQQESKQIEELRKEILELRKDAAEESANQTKKLNEEVVKLQKENSKLKLDKLQQMEIKNFRDLLVNIAQQLTPDEWRNMSYRFNIPGEKQPDCAFNFFWWLVETTQISSVDLNLLEDLLIQHQRHLLVKQFIEPYRLKNANK